MYVSTNQAVAAVAGDLPRAHETRLAGMSRRFRSRLMCAALTFAGLLSIHAPVYASAYATGGSGLYKDRILWITWGTGTTGSRFAPIASGTTSTTTFNVNGTGVVTVTCDIRNMAGTGVSSEFGGGSFSADGLDDLYNVGGTDTANQLFSGITNGNGSFTAPTTFDLACRATLNGTPYRIPGLVFADAETSRAGEFVQASAQGTWSMIERLRDCAQTTSVSKTVAGANTVLRMENPVTNCTSGPMGIAYVQLAAGAYAAGTEEFVVNASLGSNGGKSVIAFGLVLQPDLGDAPPSYGAAMHMLPAVASNDSIATGTANANLFAATLGVLSIGTTARVGSANTDIDAMPVAGTLGNIGANVDDTTGGDDEDGFASLATVDGTAASYVLNVPVTNAAGTQVCGWIDFNRNGVFENTAVERACAAPAGGSASLSWSVPANANYVAGFSYARLRIGASTDPGVSSATGGAGSGEVEDYAITLRPRIRLNKTLVPATDAGRFNLSIAPVAIAGTGAASNVGDGGTTGLTSVNINTALTLSETAGTATTLANYVSSIRCVNRANGEVLAAAVGTSRTYTSLTSASTNGASNTPATVSNQNDTEITCTASNVRTATLQLAKAWAAGSLAGNQVSIGATTGGTNNTSAFNATAPNPANSGAPVTVNVGDVITLPAETGANVGNYTAVVTCTGGHTLSGSDGKQANTLTITNGAAAVCTYTNTLISANLSITKTNTPGTNGEIDQAGDTLLSGGATTYIVTARNTGPASANGAVVRDQPAAGLSGCAVTACNATGGAACPAAPGNLLTAGGTAILAFPSGGTAAFTVVCSVN
jgi:hypothetical protein